MNSALESVLRQRNIRLTPQRLMILEAIEKGHGHITAEQILSQIRVTYPYVTLSTIYRTLELLKQARLITETDMGCGCDCYELLGQEPHHHLICQQCGEVQVLSNEFLAGLQEAIKARYGFEAIIDHLALFGRCSRCQEEVSK